MQKRRPLFGACNPSIQMYLGFGNRIAAVLFVNSVDAISQHSQLVIQYEDTVLRVVSLCLRQPDPGFRHLDVVIVRRDSL